MSDKPIGFTADMVLAILAGRKTQTRRCHNKPRYAIGDLLWVKESYACVWSDMVVTRAVRSQVELGETHIVYRESTPNGFLHGRWTSSRFMPKWAARIWLEVTGVRQERLQDISEEDAIAEGAMYVEPDGIHHWGWRYDYTSPVSRPCRAAFAYLWDSINAKRPGWTWDDNPLVPVYEFERISPESS